MASPDPVAHLVQYTVKDDDLRLPEYCFFTEVDFDKPLKKDPGVSNLKQILTGLLNSSGGDLEVRSQSGNPPTAEQRDKWLLNLDDALRLFVPQSVLQACVHIKEQSFPLSIRVKKSDKLITLNTNLFARGVGKTSCLSDVDGIHEVLRRPSLKPFTSPFLGQTSLAFGSKVAVGEGINLEFKCWDKTKEYDDRIGRDTYMTRLQDERTNKTLFAFPNMPSGGCLILGVNEDKTTQSNTIRGQRISEQGEKDVAAFVERSLSEDQDGCPRVWGDGSRPPQRGTDWDITYIPVTAGPRGERRRVIVIHFKHFPGGVWARCPESYFVSEDGFIHRMTINQWKDIVTMEGPTKVFQLKIMPSVSGKAGVWTAPYSQTQSAAKTAPNGAGVTYQSTISTQTEDLASNSASSQIRTGIGVIQSLMTRSQSAPLLTPHPETQNIPTNQQITTCLPQSTHSSQTDKQVFSVQNTQTDKIITFTCSTQTGSDMHSPANRGEEYVHTDKDTRIQSAISSRTPDHSESVIHAASGETGEHQQATESLPGTSTAATNDDGLKIAGSQGSRGPRMAGSQASQGPLRTSPRGSMIGHISIEAKHTPNFEQKLKRFFSKKKQPRSTETIKVPEDAVTHTTESSAGTESTKESEGDVAHTTESTGVLADIGSDVDADVVLDTDQVIKARDYLSWTKHQTTWSSESNQSSLSLEMNASKLADDSEMFKFATPLTLTPDRKTVINSHICSPESMSEAVDHITRSVSSVPSFGIASSNWLLNLKTELSIEKPEHHLLDVVVVGDTGAMDIWAIADQAAASLKEIEKYLFLSGRVTKRNILFKQPGTGRFLHTVNVNCFIYQVGVGEVYNHRKVSREPDPPQTADTLPAIKTALARSLLEKDTRIRSIFGDENSIILTAEQMETIMCLGLNKFNYIEGPPGSGKTYLALHLCKKSPKYGYVCTTRTFRQFLLHQQLDDSRICLLDNEADLTDEVKKMECGTLDCLIFDDSQNAKISEAAWLRFFQHISKTTELKLIVFGDSRYQNYHRSSRSLDVCDLMERYCKEHNHHFTHRTLDKVHRNTQKVVSFIKSNFENKVRYPDQAEITCSHTEDGDDVEIRRFSDTMSVKADNSFVQFVQGLIDPQKVIGSEKLSYEARDVAILLDTETPTDDANIIRPIFRKWFDKKTDVHSASTFPVTGITVDTLENFLGLDRKVCILVTSEEVIESSDPQGRSLTNPRYKTFVASRGISRVVFVVQSTLDTRLASKFILDELMLGIRRLWHHGPSDSIHDLCYIDVAGQTAALYVSGSDRALHTVSMTGEPLSISVKPDMESPWYTASSSDGRRVVVAGWDNANKGPWYWSVYPVQTGGQLVRAQTYRLDTAPWSVSWTPDGDVIILQGKPGGPFTLARLSPDHGGRVWERGQTVTRLRILGRLAVCPESGDIYVSDRDCVRVLSPDGYHSRDFPTAGIDPAALCIASPGRSLFVSDWEKDIREDSKQRDVYLVHTDGGRPTKVIRAPGRVENLRLQDRHLAVATLGKGLVMYDVEGLL